MYKRVIVPLDGSPLAEGMLSFIVDIAGPLGLEVALVHVVKAAPPYLAETMKNVVAENAEQRHEEARAYLMPLAADLSARGIRTRIEVRQGEPVQEIVGCARDIGADLIAMTTHGRSGLGRLLFGSVAEEVLRQAEIPVFLMRLTEAQLGGTRASGTP